MTDDQEKTKQEFIERFDKAKGRLPQSLPEIQKLIKTSNVVVVRYCGGDSCEPLLRATSPLLNFM
jgi:hypothetical protein